MGFFDNVQNASISQSGPKLPDGFSGILEVVACQVKQGHTGTRYIAEMVVHETNNPAEAPVGYRPSWAPDLKQPNTQGNILCFVGSCFGIDPQTQEQQLRQSITGRHVEATIDAQQLVRGRFVHCETNEIKTKNGHDFMTHRWSPTPKTFPSRINDAGVSPTGAPPAAMGSSMQMPSIPNAPGGFAPPSFGGGAPGLPPLGAPQAHGGFMPPQTAPIPGMPGGFMPQIPTAPMPQQVAPMPAAPQQAAPSFPAPTMPSLPSMPGMPGLPPGLPPLPGMGAPPPVAPAFPPPGWAAHPQAPGYFYLQSNPSVYKTEADLRAGR